MGYFLAGIFLFAWGCASEPDKNPKPVVKPTKKISEKAGVEDKKITQIPASDKCITLKHSAASAPFFIQGSNLVVTRVIKPCVTLDGDAGYYKGSQWMSMGFPCTGGGKLDWKGNFWKPKIVSFFVSNSCPMTPDTLQEAKQIGAKIGFDDARLLAYYPFALQYWELLDYSDADTGYVVELRSTPSREVGWKEFTQNRKPLRARFYGRENAWVRGKQFYYADVLIQPDAQKKYKLEILNVKALDEKEIAEVRMRCESLSPPRKCRQVFSL